MNLKDKLTDFDNDTQRFEYLKTNVNNIDDIIKTKKIKNVLYEFYTEGLPRDYLTNIYINYTMASVLQMEVLARRTGVITLIDLDDSQEQHQIMNLDALAQKDRNKDALNGHKESLRLILVTKLGYGMKEFVDYIKKHDKESKNELTYFGIPFPVSDLDSNLVYLNELIKNPELEPDVDGEFLFNRLVKGLKQKKSK